MEFSTFYLYGISNGSTQLAGAYATSHTALMIRAQADADQQQLARVSQFSDVRVIADLSMLKDVDTSALAVIVQLDRQVRQNSSRPLRIRCAPSNLIWLARLSSLESVLDFEQNFEHTGR